MTDRRIHEAVEFLVAYLPASLRLGIAGRSDPPLPLARLRARGELTELRAAELRFTPDEAAALLSTVSGAELDTGATAAVWERTEGWAAGLQLAALRLRGSPEPNVAAIQVRGDDRHLMDYFAAEVLPGLAPRQRELLVRAAPLERLSGSLCDAALQMESSADVLIELMRADHSWRRWTASRSGIAVTSSARRPVAPARRPVRRRSAQPGRGLVRRAGPDRRCGAAPAAWRR